MTSPCSWTARLVGFATLAATLVSSPPAVFAQAPTPQPAPAPAGEGWVAPANSPAYAPNAGPPQPYYYGAPGGPPPAQPYPGYPTYPQPQYQGNGSPPAPAPAPGAATASGAAPAPAVESAAADSFGKAGQLIFWADCRAGFSNYSDSNNNSGASLYLSPSVGLFVSRIVMLKLRIDLGIASSDSSGSSYMDTFAGLGFGMGFNIPIIRVLSLLPGFDLDGSYERSGFTSAGSTQTGRYVLGGSVSMPVLFHVAPHFFLGVSPYVNLSYDRATKNSSKGDTTYSEGASFLIGGWI